MKLEVEYLDIGSLKPYERNARKHHIDVIRTLARDRKWSRQKTRSIRGQVLSMENSKWEAYLRKLIARRN